MTREEAVEAIKMARAQVEWDYPMDYAAAFDMAIEALKQPERAHGRWLNFINGFSTAECSKCGEIYEVSPDEKPCEEYFNAFRQFYKFCPNCGAKMDEGGITMEWISVKDELPSTNERVLVFIPFHGISLFYVSYVESGKWYVPDRLGRYELNGITHWMPLPASPTSE